MQEHVLTPAHLANVITWYTESYPIMFEEVDQGTVQLKILVYDRGAVFTGTLDK